MCTWFAAPLPSEAPLAGDAKNAHARPCGGLGPNSNSILRGPIHVRALEARRASSWLGCQGCTRPTRCTPPLAAVLGALSRACAMFSTVASSLLCSAKPGDEYTAYQPPWRTFEARVRWSLGAKCASATPITPAPIPSKCCHTLSGLFCGATNVVTVANTTPRRSWAPPPPPPLPRGYVPLQGPSFPGRPPLAVCVGRCVGNGVARRACYRHQRRHHGCQPRRRRP